MRSLFGRKLGPTSCGGALVPEAQLHRERLPSKRSRQFQRLHPIVLTINLSNKSGHLLFAQSCGNVAYRYSWHGDRLAASLVGDTGVLLAGHSSQIKFLSASGTKCL